jgi:hypothetical protein
MIGCTNQHADLGIPRTQAGRSGSGLGARRGQLAGVSPRLLSRRHRPYADALRFRVLACRCRPLDRAVGVRPRTRAAASGSPGASSTVGTVTAGSIRPSRNLGMSTRATRRRLGSPGRCHRGPGASRRVPYGGAHQGHCLRAWTAGGSDTGGPPGIHCQSHSPVSRASARTSLAGQQGRSGQYCGPPSSWRARSACTGPCPVPLIRRWGTHRAQARSHQSADGSRAAPTPDSERAGAGPATAGGRDSDQSPEPSRAPSQPGEAVHVCTSFNSRMLFSLVSCRTWCSPVPRAEPVFPAYTTYTTWPKHQTAALS